MAVTVDLSSDLGYVDGLEAVTLNRRGSSSNVSVSNALQRAVSTREVEASNGQYTQGDVRWHLPATEVSTTPRIGDSIIDASANYWVVLSVQEATLSNRWLCVSRCLAIQYGLDDAITIEVAAYSKGTGGAAERAWTTWKTARARIQEVLTDIEVREGAQRAAKVYEIYTDADYEIDQTHRIKDHKGNKYRITGTSGVGEVGGLQTIEATDWRQA